jgi:hypothetical protein
MNWRCVTEFVYPRAYKPANNNVLVKLDGSQRARLINMRVRRQLTIDVSVEPKVNFLTRLHSQGSPLFHARRVSYKAKAYWFNTYPEKLLEGEHVMKDVAIKACHEAMIHTYQTGSDLDGVFPGVQQTNLIGASRY